MTDPVARVTPDPVRVELLSAPDCPNVDTTRRMVHECLAELGLDATVIERVGSYRSPTVLVDGIDVMSPVTGEPLDGAACRLDLPSRERVLAAVEACLARHDRRLTLDSLRDPAGDGTAARAAALPARLRELHRRILRAFLADGRAPDPAQVHAIAADIGLDVADGLDRLAELDLVRCGHDGRIRVAYPFSGVPTGHRVQLLDRPSVDAMCALDALGIPLMAALDGVITSSDPSTGQVIRVVRRAREWWWEPVDAVVLLAQTDGHGPASECLCPSILFHVDRDHAERHLATQPGWSGSVLGHEEATEIARACFGSLLAA
jgi:alkylmercury lyase